MVSVIDKVKWRWIAHVAYLLASGCPLLSFVNLVLVVVKHLLTTGGEELGAINSWNHFWLRFLGVCLLGMPRGFFDHAFLLSVKYGPFKFTSASVPKPGVVKSGIQFLIDWSSLTFVGTCKAQGSSGN